MNLATLRRKAADNSLEVEHLLKAARLKLPGLWTELELLASQHDWSLDNQLADGSHVVPFGRWAKVAGAFASGGYEALRPLALDDIDAPCVVGLIEELNSAEAIDQLFVLFAAEICNPLCRPAVSHKLVSALNLLFSVKSSPPTTHNQRAVAAAFLNKALSISTTNVERANVLYALRGAGDLESLEALADIDEPDAPFAGARTLAMRSIRKRLEK